MTLYEFLKFVHVLAAIVWVGGNISLHVVAQGVLNSGDSERMATFAKDAERIGTRVYVPAALVLLVAGVWMVLENDLGFDRGWIMAGIGGFAFSLVIGAAFNGPEAKRLGEVIDQRGADDPEVARRIRRLFGAGRVELVVLLMVVFFMTTKVWD